MSLLGAPLDVLVRTTLYPAPPVPVPSPPPAPLVEVTLPLAGGGEASAWLRRIDRGDGAARPPLVLFFHGNGENLETLRASGFFEDAAAIGVDVLAVDYPGYGRSPGAPSEASLAACGDAALAWAGSDGAPTVVACGWSLGAGVAVPLAARRGGLAGLVALSPWTSLGELAAHWFPGWLVRAAIAAHRFDSLAAAPAVRLPTLVVHGSRDTIIPAAHGERLAAAIPGALWVPVPETGHNDLFARAATWRALAAFVHGLAR